MGEPAATMETRPQETSRTIAKVLGVLNLGFGIMGLLFGGLGLLMGLIAMSGLLPAEIDALVRPLISPWAIAKSLGEIASSALLLAAGWGLFQFRPSGRSLSIVYSIIAIFWSTGMLVVSAINIPKMMENLPEEDSLGLAEVFTAFEPALNVSLSCAAMLYPIILLLFLCRKSFREAITAQQDEA